MNSFRSVIPTPAFGGGIPTERYEPQGQQQRVLEVQSLSTQEHWKTKGIPHREKRVRNDNRKVLRVQSFWLSSSEA
jgi:hypothetical protein